MAFMNRLRKLTLSLVVVAITIGAGMPRQAQAINEIAQSCQLPGAYLTETGLDKLINTGIAALATAYLNPIDDVTTRQKKKIKKAIVMLGGGVVLMSVCPPLVVPEGFSAWQRDDRVDWAIDKSWDPISIADMSFEVNEPQNPQSCDKDLRVDINNSGQLLDGRDFPELEFVYVEPYGSFPSAVEHYNEIVARVQEQINALISQFLTSFEPFESAIANISDFTDRIDKALADLGINPSLSFFFPDIDEWILDLIGLGLAPNCDSVGLECEFRLKFDKWGSDLLTLKNAGAIKQTPDGFAFPDGPSQVKFDSDINTGFSTEIKYGQDIFVKEYFEPEFNVVGTDADPEGGPDLNIIADFVFEALEPGKADRSYTPPSSLVGAIEVTDNCDPNPQMSFGVPTELPLGGPYYFRISAMDRALNVTGNPENDPFCNGAATHPDNPDPKCKKYAIKVTVVDTRPPDLAPLDPVGITVPTGTTEVQFSDWNVGCSAFNCQLTQPTAQLFPPPVFDFATIDPDYACFATNSTTAGLEEPCDGVTLKAGEETSIRWVATDESGQSAEVTQLVAVREDGLNQRPIALGTSVTIPQDTQTPITLEATDPEFDPISFQVRTQPLNGALNITADPEFQTRFSATGTITDLVDIVRVDQETGGGGRFANILADPVAKRLIAVNDIEVLDALYFESLTPHSIAFEEGDHLRTDKLFHQPGALVDNLLIADWSTRRLHGLLPGSNSLGSAFIPDAGLDLTGVIMFNPAHFELVGRSTLVITDPDPDDPTGGRVHLVSLGNITGDNGPADWTLESYVTLEMGYNPTAISMSFPHIEGCPNPFAFPQLLLGDWDNGMIHQVLLTSETTLLSTSSWNVTDYLNDPPGDARADLGRPQDMALLTDDCLASETAPLEPIIVDDLNKNLEGMRLPFSGGTLNATADTPQSLASEFSRLFAVEAITNNEFLTLERGRIAKFDLFGNLKSNLQTFKPDGSGILQGSQENERLVPLDDSSWASMDTDHQGNAFLLSFGNESNNITNEVVKFQLSRGQNNYTLGGRINLDIPNGNSDERGRAISHSPGLTTSPADDVIYALTDNGLERLDATLSSTTILFEFDNSPCAGSWCPVASVEFPQHDLLDMDADDMGNLYITDLANQRVHKFGHDGSYVGWLGKCDSGSGCDTFFDRSNGFSCTNATCTVAVKAGTMDGQFNFADEAVDQNKPRPSSGSIEVNIDAQQLIVSDNPDLGSGRIPRVQIFSLDGMFVSSVIPDGQPGQLLSFLEVGDFNTINDISATADSLFVIEDEPLRRLHVFDINPFQATIGGAIVEYIPNNGFVGEDTFDYSVRDSFGAKSDVATVLINVIADTEDPQISCPEDIIIEGTDTGGAIPASLDLLDGTGSVLLAEFLASASAKDNIMIPPPQITTYADIVDDLYPVNEVTEVEFTATDYAGNTARCFADVTVEDTIPPLLTAPVDLVVEATGPVTTVNPGVPMVADAVGAITGTTPASFDFAIEPASPFTTHTLRWEAVDAGGNSAGDEQLITVQDTVAPVINMPVFAGGVSVNGNVATQQAVNGHTNPFNIIRPVATDLVGIAKVEADFVYDEISGQWIDGVPVDVTCSAPLAGQAASIAIDYLCFSRDVSGNVGQLDFTYDIVQINSDSDPFTDIIDAQPGLGDDAQTFSDQPLGGTSSGTFSPANGGSWRIMDAYLENQGIRAEWTGPDANTPENSTNFNLCNDTLETSNFEVVLDEVGDVDANAFTFTCGAANKIRNHLGVFRATWALPQGFQARVMMPESAALAIDGWTATADAENPVDVVVQVANNLINVAPGQVVDLQPYSNYSPSANLPDVNFLEDFAGSADLNLALYFTDNEDPVQALTYNLVGADMPEFLSLLSINGSIVSVAPAANVFGTSTVTVSATDTDGLSGFETFDVVIAAVNDAPTLIFSSTNFEADEDSGPHSFAIASITTGPANEADQTISTQITSDNPGLFAVGPVLDEDGLLSFETATDAFGSARLDITVTDSGGELNGGVNAVSGGFDVVIQAVNDPPLFSQTGGIFYASAAAGPVTLGEFASSMRPGPGNEFEQTLTGFDVKLLGTDGGVATNVQMDLAGTLSFERTGTNGSSAYSVTLKDDAGIDRGGRDTSDPRVFTLVVGGGNVDLGIRVTAVNGKVDSGDDLDFTITVDNAGPEDVAGAKVELTLSPQLVYPRFRCPVESQDKCAIQQSGTATVSLLQNEIITLDVTVLAQALAGESDFPVLSAEVFSPPGMTETQPQNNISDDDVLLKLFSNSFEDP